MPRKAAKTTEKEAAPNIATSPLLARSTREPMRGGLHSTISPDKLEQSRFSDMQDDDENPLRIVIYILVVVVIGIGSAFGVRQLMSKGDSETQPEGQTQQESGGETTDQAVKVNTQKLSDTSAINQPKLAQFTDSSLVSVGNTIPSVDGISVSSFEYQNFTTFSRATFKLKGLNLADGFPKTTLAFDAIGKKLEVKIENITDVNQDLMEAISIQDTVKEVRYDKVKNSFVIFFTEEVKYRSVINTDTLIIDIKTKTQIEKEENAEEEQSEETPAESQPTEETTTTPTPTPTGEKSYNNEFSKNVQSVVSAVTGNSVDYDKTYFEDMGPYFEIAWGTPGKVGDSFVPNATAELVENGSEVYIDLTISNLSGLPSTSGVPTTANDVSAQLGIDMTGANFVQIELVSYSGGTANFKITLLRSARYRLASETTVSGDTQVLALQIED